MGKDAILLLELIQMIFLAVVQGLTEFLPVSSSGHLVLLQSLLGTREGDVFFDVVLHCGTLGSVVFAYRHEIGRLLRFDGAAIRYLVSLAVATLPAVAFGLLAQDLIESLFHSPAFVGVGLLISAAALLSTRASSAERDEESSHWEPVPVHPVRSLAIGMAQALAILPGVSRSGMTISASLWSGLARSEAARFSFLLSIPAIGGALVLQLFSGEPMPASQWAGVLSAAVVAFFVGLLALRWTALAVVKAHFWKFGFYCLVLGGVVLVVLR